MDPAIEAACQAIEDAEQPERPGYSDDGLIAAFHRASALVEARESELVNSMDMWSISHQHLQSVKDSAPVSE